MFHAMRQFVVKKIGVARSALAFAVQHRQLPAQHAIIPANELLRQELLTTGHAPSVGMDIAMDVQTRYSYKTPVFVLDDLSPGDAVSLARRHGCRGVTTHLGYHDLIDSKLYPSRGVHEVTHGDVYTELPGGRRFVHDINWSAPLTL